jgi:hypothetical protein
MHFAVALKAWHASAPTRALMYKYLFLTHIHPRVFELFALSRSYGNVFSQALSCHPAVTRRCGVPSSESHTNPLLGLIIHMVLL